MSIHLQHAEVCRYVMDELGSALQHSDEANFRVVPFLFMPEGKLESAVRYFIFTIAFMPFQLIFLRGVHGLYKYVLSLNICYLALFFFKKNMYSAISV